MKLFLKNFFFGWLFIFMVASPALAIVIPQSVSAAPGCEGRLVGIPPWYRGLTNENPPECTIKSPDDVGGIGNFIWRIVLNVIEMAIVATTYLTIILILYGGFLYITGGAIPSQVEKAKKTILNAVVGLVICLSAIALTNLIFRIIT